MDSESALNSNAELAEIQSYRMLAMRHIIVVGQEKQCVSQQSKT